jgi:hypothetical protein
VTPPIDAIDKSSTLRKREGGEKNGGTCETVTIHANYTGRSMNVSVKCKECVEVRSTEVEDAGQVEQLPEMLRRLWRRGLLSALQRSALLSRLSPVRN